MKQIIRLKQKPLTIVGDGLVSTTNRGDGRFIPALILDTATRPDIQELIRVHGHLPPGDVATQWGTIPFAKENIFLKMKFLKPMSCEFIIAFNPMSQWILIDAILHAQGLYFYAGKPGDTISSTLNEQKVLAEVPKSSFIDLWNKMIPNILKKQFRQEGLPRNAARSAAIEMLKSIREMWDVRRQI